MAYINNSLGYRMFAWSDASASGDPLVLRAFSDADLLVARRHKDQQRVQWYSLHERVQAYRYAFQIDIRSRDRRDGYFIAAACVTTYVVGRRGVW